MNPKWNRIDTMNAGFNIGVMFGVWFCAHSGTQLEGKAFLLIAATTTVWIIWRLRNCN